MSLPLRGRKIPTKQPYRNVIRLVLFLKHYFIAIIKRQTVWTDLLPSVSFFFAALLPPVAIDYGPGYGIFYVIMTIARFIRQNVA